MIYLLFGVISTLTAAAVAVFGARKGVADFGEKLKIYKPCGEEISPYRGKTLILTILICAALAAALLISLYKNVNWINFCKLYGAAVIVFCAAMVDSKRKIIPNVLIVTGVVFRLAIYGWELLSKADMGAIVRNDIVGLLLGFGVLSLVCLLTKGALGFGDAKLFGIIGITCGAFCTYTTLFFSLIVSLAVSLIGLLRKKLGRKDAFPFGPCIAVGYAAAILLKCY